MNYRNIETLSLRHTDWITQVKDLEEEKGFKLSENVDFFVVLESCDVH